MKTRHWIAVVVCVWLGSLNLPLAAGERENDSWWSWNTPSWRNSESDTASQSSFRPGQWIYRGGKRVYTGSRNAVRTVGRATSNAVSWMNPWSERSSNKPLTGSRNRSQKASRVANWFRPYPAPRQEPETVEDWLRQRRVKY